MNLEKTLTENGAAAHASTGSVFADQFAKAGAFRGRPIAQVFADQATLHNEHGIYALRFAFYLRLITRTIAPSAWFKSENVQKGQGNRDESFKRLLWYAQNHPNTFYKNLYLLPIVGSYRDILDLMWCAEENNVKLDYAKCLAFFPLLNEEEKFNYDLYLKYLPNVKATSKCRTKRSQFRNKIAKTIAKNIDGGYKTLRQIKSGGKGHIWQQLISKNLYKLLNFNGIPGKALLKLVSGKFLKNSGLETQYVDWIKTKPVAKFTGYPYELGKVVNSHMPVSLKYTVDKQFEGLLQLARKNGGALTKRKVVCAIDRSASMGTGVAGTSAMNIAESLGIYFANLLEGEFKNWVIKFSKNSEWVKLAGTFSEQKLQMQWGDCPSNTDFHSVINSFVKVRNKYPDLAESEFPDTVLVVSDMQFDGNSTETAYAKAKKTLAEHFSKEYVDRFTFVWWDCTGRVPNNQPQTIDEPGGYVVSGFDGGVVSLLLGGMEKNGQKTTMEQNIQEILEQDVLKIIEE